MWISRKKWEKLEKRISALEQKGQERNEKTTFNSLAFSQHVNEGVRHALGCQDLKEQRR